VSHRILVVEDEAPLRRGLVDALKSEGYHVTACDRGDEAETLLLSRHFDLVLLDLMLPGKDGLQVLRALRAAGLRTDVVVLTAKGSEPDRVLGLELGADDYVTKPFSLRELMARVRNRLRRMKPPAESTALARFRLGDAEVDLAAFQVTRNGRSEALSPKEAGILGLLFREAGKAVSRHRCLDEVWGTDQFVSTRTVDMHVLNLRQKLEPDPKSPRHLLTVHGVGYRLEGSYV
jgi:DNA-binding response OmpR family regulator